MKEFVAGSFKVFIIEGGAKAVIDGMEIARTRVVKAAPHIRWNATMILILYIYSLSRI